MKAKDEALELTNKFIGYAHHNFLAPDNKMYLEMWDNAIKCSLIAVEFAKKNPLNTDGWYNKYLDEVKIELEKLWETTEKLFLDNKQ